MTANHVTPRKFLAREIKLARVAKGLKDEELATALYVSVSLVRAWEKGRRLPVPSDMDRIEEFFGFNGVLRRMRDDLVNAAVPLEWFGRWPEIERLSVFLWSVETTVFPGLLQTEDYAYAVLRAAQHAADTDEMVSARLDRQQVLVKEDAPLFVCLLSESVLWHNVGGARVMAEQLEYVLQMMERDNVIIHVVPNKSLTCAIFSGPFVVANFDGGKEAAYVDNQLAGEVIEDADDIARLRRMFDTLRADALSQQESTELIQRMAEHWKA